MSTGTTRASADGASARTVVGSLAVVGTAARLVTVVGLAFAVLVAATVTASATFSETVPASPVQVSTATIPAVDGLEVKFVVCDLTTVSAQVEWRGSTARNVTGYRVTAHMQNGQTELISQAGPDVLEVPLTRSRTWLQGRPTFTVTVLTSYGWTSQTAKSEILTC